MQNQKNTAKRNFLVFGTIESKISRCFILLPDGTRTPDEETREKLRRAFVALIAFFSKNNLLRVSAFSPDGVFIDREYLDSDVSDEALQMIKQGAEKWLDSKSAQKIPPNYRKLEKMLSDIRQKR